MVNFSWSRRTEGCKILPACLNFSGLAPASLSDQPEPAKSAIFGKIGGKTINLAGIILHNSVDLITGTHCSSSAGNGWADERTCYTAPRKMLKSYAGLPT